MRQSQLRPVRVTALTFTLFSLLPWSAHAVGPDPDPEPDSDGADVVAEAPSIPVLQDPDFTMDFGVTVQTRYTYLDPEGSDATGSFEVRRLRPAVSGEAYGQFTYRVVAELAGSSARLLDGWIGYELSPEATITVGQAKAPFGRQQLVSSSRLQFVDRAITDRRFNPSRQPGVWIGGSAGEGQVEYSAGLYNGEGINRRNEDGDYMKVGRVVWTPLGAYGLQESALDRPEDPRLALGVAAMHTTVDVSDDPDDGTADVVRVNLEGAFKVGGFNAAAELTFERSKPDIGDDQDTVGWYIQPAWLFESGWEIAGRYAVISPDSAAGIDLDESERGIGISRYLEGHDVKIQADFVQYVEELSDTTDNQVRVQLQLRI